MISLGNYSMGERGSQDSEEAAPAREGGLDAQLDRIVPSEAPAAFLMVVAGEQPGRVHPLAKNTVIIGRAPNADIRIADRSVSNEHARIINGSAGFEVEDLSSTNGTFVGARKVMRSRLKNGDRVRIGSVEFAFLVDRESDATIALISAAAVPMRRETIALPAMRPATSSSDDEGMSLEELVHKGVSAYQFLRRYALVIGFLLGAGGTLGFASAFVLPSAPTAFCQIKLLPAPQTNPMGGADQFRSSDQGDTQTFFAAAETAFTNPELIRQSLKAMGDPTPTNDTLLSVASRLAMTTEGNRIYKATYKESMFGTPRNSPVEFLTVHMRTYLEGEIAKMLKLYTSQAAFFKAKADGLDKDFRDVEKRMVQYQEQNADRLPGQELTTYTSRATLEAHRAEIAAQLMRVEADLSNARRQISADRPLAPWKEQSASMYRTQLGTVNGKIADAHARGLGDLHPEVVALLKERENLQNLIAESLKATASPLERGGNTAYAQAQSSVDGLDAQARGLRAQLGSVDKDLKNVKKVMGDLPRVLGEINELTRQRDMIKRQHEVALQEQQKAELQLDIEKGIAQNRYDIVVRPQLDPIRKKRVLALRTAIGLGVGIMLTIFIIFLLEARRIISESMRPGSRRRDYARP